MKSIAIALAALALAGCASPALAQQPAQPAAVEMKDVTWAKHTGLDLLATIYRDPKAPKTPLPVLIDIHGGAWGSGDRTNDRLYATELAKIRPHRHLVRLPPGARLPASGLQRRCRRRRALCPPQRQDAERRPRPHRPHRLLLRRASRPARGRAARRTAAQGNAHPRPRWRLRLRTTISPPMSTMSSPCGRSVDPAARYRYAKRASMPRLPEMSLAYFKTEDADVGRIHSAHRHRQARRRRCRLSWSSSRAMIPTSRRT